MFLAFSSFSRAAEIALIYDGIGSCSNVNDPEDKDAGKSGYSCAKAAEVIAIRAGFTPKLVGPQAITDASTTAQVKALFKNARVWIQPGGNGKAYYNMSNRLRTELNKFVADGGGYVGWCAGAFMATHSQYNQTAQFIRAYAEGFESKNLLPNQTYAFEKIKWLGKSRRIYFEGGPYFTPIDKNPKFETVALYDTGQIAAIRGNYLKGRVFVSGPHPEAPEIWAKEDGNKDPDGLDHDLAAEMVTWAAAKKPFVMK